MESDVMIFLMALLFSLPGALLEKEAEQKESAGVKAAAGAEVAWDCYFDAMNVYHCKPVDYSLLGKGEVK